MKEYFEIKKKIQLSKGISESRFIDTQIEKIEKELISDNEDIKESDTLNLIISEKEQYLDWLKKYKEIFSKDENDLSVFEIELKINNQSIPTTNHPIHDPNLWSIESYELFKYLKDKYHKSTIKQITNIWFYLKNDTDIKYKCTATKKQYREFIETNYSITITNFDKSSIDNYQSKQLVAMNNHLKYYKETLK